MVASVSLFTGPAGSGKSAQLLELYRERLKHAPHGTCLWIAPNHSAAAAIRRRLIDGSLFAVLDPGIVTFGQLAERLLVDAPFTPLSPLVRRLLLRRIIDQLRPDRLTYFAPVAGTAGMVDTAADFISELRRHDVSAESFSSHLERSGATGRLIDLARIYRDYERWLHDHQRYDQDGRFHQALMRIRSGQSGNFSTLDFVVVDGFTDFTPSQHEILTELTHRASDVCFGLTLDEAADRKDLFAKPIATRNKLNSSFSQLDLQRISFPHAPVSCRDRIRCLLFSEQVSNFVNEHQGNNDVEILAAATPRHEIEQIAHRIKQLLLDDAPNCVVPSDVAVIFRNPQSDAALVGEIFTRFGVPFEVAASVSLDTVPSVRAFFDLLDLVVDRPQSRHLIAGLSNNYFAPELIRRESLAAAIEFVRRIDRRLTLTEWSELARRMADIETNGPATDTNSRNLKIARAARSALPTFEFLAEVSRRLPTRATPPEWADALESWSRTLGIFAVAAEPLEKSLQADRPPTASNTVEPDVVAMTQLFDLMRTSAREFPGSSSMELDVAQVHAHLVEIAAWAPGPRDRATHDVVRVLPAIAARAAQFPIVFLARLTESAYTAHTSDDPLATEAERQRIAELNPSIPTADSRRSDERLLFYEMASLATRRLILSYPTVDDAGHALLPSPLLSELAECCGISDRPDGAAKDLSPVPATDTPQTALQWRRLAVHNALIKDCRHLAALANYSPTSQLAHGIDAGLAAIANRRDRVFGDYEGLILSDTANDRLRAAFGENHPWSPDRLGQFARCPHQFFLEHLIRLDEPPPATLQVDHRARGAMFHEALANTHLEINQSHGVPRHAAEVPPDEFMNAFGAAVDELLPVSDDDSPVDVVLRELDRRRVIDWARRYVEQSKKYVEGLLDHDEPPRPWEFEVAFGAVDSHEVDPDSNATSHGSHLVSDRPLELPFGDQVIRFTGRIDRLDVGVVDGQRVFHLIDFKTGRYPAKTIDDARTGRALQLAIYAIAVERLLADEIRASGWHAGYWFPAADGFVETFRISNFADAKPPHRASPLAPTDEWRDLRDKIAIQAGRLVTAIRRGQFPMINEDDRCTGYCPYNTVCRVNHARALEKPWQPPEA